MLPADIDPSLCTSEPTLDSLDDGFSPPAQDMPRGPDGEVPGRPLPSEPGLGGKSLF